MESLPVSRSQSAAYQIFMLALCLLALGALGARTASGLDPEIRTVLDHADNAICLFFLLDFLICVARAPDRWRYLYTWGWLDLLSSIPVLDVARWGRAARAARLLRVIRSLRATRVLSRQILERRAKNTLLAACLLAVLLVIATSITMLNVETAAGSEMRTAEGRITTAEDALWWAIATVTTVGYGDRLPFTSEGRVVASLLMILGVGLSGVLSGFFAAWFLEPEGEQTSTEIAALRNELAQLRALLERQGALG